MKNNVKGFIFHIFVIIIVSLIAIVINLNESVINIVYGNIIFRVILALIPIVLYYNLGKGMSKRTTKKLDFLTGNLIIATSIILFIIAFVGLGADLFETSVAGSMWKFPLDLFLLPELYIFQMFNISYNIFTIFIAAIFPGIIYGISIKKSRAKIMKRKRMMKHKNNRTKNN